MLKYFVLLLAIPLTSFAFGQVPTSCFEIESILVDACGTPEGENEMVRIKIGSSPLNVSDIVIDWPNNPYQGICQNATTAQAVSDLNATITSCGYLVEPTGGVLPAGASVLIITSEAIDVTANSFTNLTDTLYTIFQCVGNTQGHFANYNTTPGLRTLAVSFTNPPGCNDTVTYDRTILINQNGTLGGTTALKNGARVDFAWDDTPTYANDGCQAPIIIADISISTTSMLDTVIICPGDSIVFNSLPTGGYNTLYWTGNEGVFSSQDTINTVYYSSLNDTLPFYIFGGLESYCNDSIFDSIFVEILPKPSVSVTSAISDLCPGDTIPLTATGVTTYLWNTGETTPIINIDSAGTFVVYGSDGCFLDSAFITITANGTLPSLSISGSDSICVGDSTSLTVSGFTPFTWSTGETTPAISVNSPQNIYVHASNICGADTAFLTVGSFGTAPSISVTGNTSICTGDSTLLIASGDTLYTWSTGLINDSIYVNSSQSLYAFSSNVCGSDTAFITVVSLGAPPSVSISGNDSICVDDSTSLTVSGSTPFTWSTGETTTSVTVNFPQNIYVFSSNGCGADTAFLTVESLGAIPSISITGNTNICIGDSALLTASGDTLYTWSTGLINDSIYINSSQSLYVFSSNVCGSDTAFVNVVSLGFPPSISLSGTDSICLGDSTLFNATGGTNYTWSTGQTTDSIYIDTAQSFYVFSSNGCGVDTAFSTVSIFGSVPNAGILGNNVICDGLPIELIASGGDTYTWWNGSTNDTINTGTIETIYVVAENICGTDTLFFTISDGSVTANFSVSDSSGIAPLTVDFTNTSINASSYSWSFEDGTNTSEINPSHEYIDSGYTYVTLIATGAFGCSDTAIIWIDVTLPPQIIIPNVFTPNGDNQNNLFFVDASLYKGITGTIYNRWGQVMYQWGNSNIGWDGYYNGQESPEGTYFYIITVVSPNNQEENFSGAFSLFR